MLQTIKKFFNKLLHIGSEKDKDNVVEEINNYIYEQNYGIDIDYDDRDIDI